MLQICCATPRSAAAFRATIRTTWEMTMPATFALAALLMAQAASPGITVEAPTDPYGVGYRELIAQKPAAAIERIQADWNVNADDPAALINLGTAAARLGDKTAAR